MNLGPPYTDVRVEPFDRPTVYELRMVMPGLISIDFHPPASGPEVELTFATAENAEAVGEDFIKGAVERLTGRPVLAIRRRHH